MLTNQSSNAALAAVLQDVHKNAEEGTSVGEAMQARPRAFGEMGISIGRAGGEGGFLEEALSHLAISTQQQQDWKNRTASPLAYPVFLGVVGISVVTIPIIFFVPKFEGLFQ